LAPELDDDELDDVLTAVSATGMDGVIATNTTVSRGGLRSPLAQQAGGLSGAPLEQRSTEVVKMISARTGGKLPVVGVGGVMGPEDARRKLDAGATLVQIYTGMVYRGPGLVRQIVESL
jgi:dihydroorotate dehydrogenase